MNPRIPNRSVRKIRSAIATATLMSAIGQAQAVEVTRNIDYECQFPLVGPEIVATAISADLPEEVYPGPTDEQISLVADATFNDNVRTSLLLVNVATIEGVVQADTLIQTDALDLNVVVDMDLPTSDLPTNTGPFTVTASGSIPQPAFGDQMMGEISMTVGDLTLNLISRKSDGSLPNDMFGEFTAPCTQPEGQDNVFSIPPTDPFDDPKISVRRSSIDFGNVIQGTATTETVAVSNIGGADLSINSVSMTGSSFTKSNDNCFILTPNDTCSFDVTFAPVSIGTQTGEVTIDSNSVEPAESISLTGNGTTAPESLPEISPESITFDMYNLGSQSGAVTETVTISNEGDAGLQIDSIGFDANSDTAFSSSHNCGTIAANDSCPVTVSFLPTQEGDYNGNLVVDYATPGLRPGAVPVTGTASEIIEPAPLLELKGTTSIARSNSILDLTGSMAIELDLTSGLLDADLALDPTTARIPVVKGWDSWTSTSRVEFEQTRVTTGTLNNGKLQFSSEMYVLVPEVKVPLFGFNVKIGGGDECRTSEPTEIVLESAEGENFSPTTGGRVTGTYNLPELENCGWLTGLVNSYMAGPGNTMDLQLTPGLW